MLKSSSLSTMLVMVVASVFTLTARPGDNPGGFDASTVQDAHSLADVQAGVDSGQLCTSASECTSGQGCHEGQCAACQSADDCRADLFEGCNGGICGPCTAAGQCAQGLGCRQATGECRSCRSSQECRSGEGCIDGVCGACSTASNCAGALCVEGQCVGCVPGDDDSTCQRLFDDPGMYCRDDGKCGPNLCESGLDCVILQEVCDTSSSRCRTCNNSSECLDDSLGGYAAGTLCVDGACLEANCTDSAACPVDRPVCGSDHRCRSCQLNQECLDREGVTTGFVCDLERGRCAAGDCYPGAEACGEAAAGQICGDDFVCAGCENNSQCDQAYSSNHLCMDGQCEVAECNEELPCANERVCLAGSCVDCTSDEQSFCLNQGRICNATTHVCAPCTTSPECGFGYVCISGNCLEGECAVPNEVNPYNPCQYCNGATHLWVDKSINTSCGDCQICKLVSSAQNDVDAGLNEDAGVSGDAGSNEDAVITCQFVAAGEDPNDDCPQDCRVCDGEGGCRPLNTDSDPDPDPNNDCQASNISICGFNGSCAGGSSDCAYWTGGVGEVNDGNPCTVNDRCNGAGGKTGDFADELTWCEGGKVCKSGSCVACNTGECGDDAVCQAGLCRGGNCTSPTECSGSLNQCEKWACTNNHCVRVADEDKHCTRENRCSINDVCGADAQCHLAATPQQKNCGTTTNSCTEMVCSEHCDANNLNCTATSCDEVPSHENESCNFTGDNCHTGRCSNGTCVRNSLIGGCYIDEACYDNGSSPDSTHSCAYCSENSNNTAWTVQDGTCYIDETCYDENTANNANECQYCGASDTSWSNYDSTHSCTANGVCEPVCSGGSCASRWQYSCLGGGDIPRYNCIWDSLKKISWNRNNANNCSFSQQVDSITDARAICANILPHNAWRLPSSAELASLISSDTDCNATMCTSSGSHTPLRTSSSLSYQIIKDQWYWVATGILHFKRMKFTDATITELESSTASDAQATAWCVRPQ